MKKSGISRELHRLIRKEAQGPSGGEHCDEELKIFTSHNFLLEFWKIIEMKISTAELFQGWASAVPRSRVFWALRGGGAGASGGADVNSSH